VEGHATGIRRGQTRVIVPPTPLDEAERIAELHALGILDSPPEERFDRITRTAQRLFDVPIALVSLVDAKRQWFKSCIGLGVPETDRSISFCAHALLRDEPLVIADAQADERFADNPLVTGDPFIRFYAGQPLRTQRGRKLGTLCVIDRRPRTLGTADLQALRDLGAWAEMELNRVEMTQALRIKRESEAEVRAIMESVADGIVVFDRAGVIVAVNAAAERLLGAAPGALVGRAIGQHLADVGIRERIGYHLAALEQGGAARLASQSWDVEACRMDGTCFRAEISIGQRAGPAPRLVASVRDVTEREKAQEAQARLAAIVEGSDDAIYAWGLDGTVTQWNPAAERLYGYTAQEIIGQPLARMIPPAQGADFLESFERLRRGEQVGHHETVRLRKDGTQVEVALSLAAIRDARGQVVGAASIARDITARRLLEAQVHRSLADQARAIAELERLNKAKSDFVSIVSHEFRTPLTGITGFSEVLRDQELSSEEVHEFAADIHKDAQRLARLINDMLDLDRLESGRFELHFESVDLNALIREVVEQFRGAAATHPVRLELETSLRPLLADRDKLTQVLTNLMSNAIKYSPAGGKVVITTREGEQAVEITVQDHGIGIPVEALKIVFERYARVETGAARQVQGTGLGLPIVRQIARLHGGDAWAESSPGVGSIFHVRLPRPPPLPQGEP
jgi:PAS domain S-box-containing protein